MVGKKPPDEITDNMDIVDNFNYTLESFINFMIEISDDIRYNDWGVHPVDIRSKHNAEKRPFDGALLAIEDSKKTERLTIPPLPFFFKKSQATFCDLPFPFFTLKKCLQILFKLEVYV